MTTMTTAAVAMMTTTRGAAAELISDCEFRNLLHYWQVNQNDVTLAKAGVQNPLILK
jgi:hypothetical protein